MKITFESGTTIDLIKKLDEDLSRVSEIVRLGRMPEPKSGHRYREILLNMYRESGFVSAIIFIDFKDGTRKVYTFYGKALPQQGVDDLLSLPVYTEGYCLVKKGGKTVETIIYNPYTFKDSYELFKLISEFGERYRLTDYEVYLDKMIEYMNVDDLFQSDVGG